MLETWIDQRRPSQATDEQIQQVEIPPSRARFRRDLDPRLEAVLSVTGDPLLAPLRVVWRAGLRDGRRSARFSDLLKFGDPRDPGRLRQLWVSRRHADRVVVVAGEPARASELRERWRAACAADLAQTTGFAEYVARQAALTLERAERRLRGARYKVPRLVHEDILGRASFRGSLAALAGDGQSEPALARRASRLLKEIAATHSPFVIDLVAQIIRWIYTRGYGENIHYDREQLAGVYSLAQRHPVVFLPTHKSNLDHLVLQYILHENGHPPNHTAGGINMNFFPVGPLVKRSGVFFIRRSFKNDELYKHVLRSYIDYLVEKRFSLEWYVEGGRSRSGKLLPPRFGLLAYVVDSYRRAKSDDVFLIPVSIAYDQITDVTSYAEEQRGAAKEKESFGWFVSFLRGLRRRYGDIHIRFGEPLSLAEFVGPSDPNAPPDADERDLDVQKLAFEVSVRINRVTPITPTSLLTLALLGRGDRSLSVEEVRSSLENLLQYVARKKLPTTADFDELQSLEGIERTLRSLQQNNVVSCYDKGPEAVYEIGADQQYTAAYYRNSIVHFFVESSIAELALLRAGERDVEDAHGEFFDEVMRLRDLLKFEFFFAGKESYRLQIRQELAFHDPDWETELAAGPEGARRLASKLRPYTSHRVLRPFLESYRVVGDRLARAGSEAPLSQEALIADCLTLGHQYRLQRRLHSGASVSKVIFQTALRLADNRELMASEATDLSERRRAFAAEIRDALRRVDAVEALAATRRAGFIP
ncbi:MAG: glycerol-3-phosphate 1-O-acyltransferase [Proteobacteria bacterium]|nr:glycerol-3-phosphate 1-O-acyltransferase [Pseudomonadota bacterium]